MSFLTHEYSFLYYFFFPWKSQVERAYILSILFAATVPIVEDRIWQYNQGIIIIALSEKILK